MWKLHGSLTGDDSLCWAAPHDNKQGRGLIQGSYRDYEVKSLTPPH